MQLNDVELYKLIGGAGFNATFVNAIIRGASFIFDFGKTIGTAIRRSITGNICQF